MPFDDERRDRGRRACAPLALALILLGGCAEIDWSATYEAWARSACRDGDRNCDAVRTGARPPLSQPR